VGCTLVGVNESGVAGLDAGVFGVSVCLWGDLVLTAGQDPNFEQEHNEHFVIKYLPNHILEYRIYKCGGFLNDYR
jgi:hypothetical protein